MAWEAGAAGEQATGAVLDRLDPTVWTVWHDVRWPGRLRANIDHVVLGPPGVLVIDSKNWSGAVAVVDGVLRQDGRTRDKAVAGAADGAAAVARLVVDVPVQPVLCFARDESLTGWAGEVMVCSTNNLDVMVQTRSHVLTAEQVGAVSAKLAAGLASRTDSNRVTMARRGSRKPSIGRPLVGLAMVAVMAAGLTTGLFTTGIEWVGDQVANVNVDEPESDTIDTKRQGNQKPAGRRRKEQQRQR